eukprot:Transcript_18365.p2 GENE.Transcript_18365~~Transcript_18365.p2  ORF type:complete len:387 (+),score=195.96 Transcript_18365:1342-2502(+)
MLDINEVYNMRTRLHQYVYQHRGANLCEGMITDVLHASSAFQFRGADGEITTLADAVHDPASFVMLTDSVLDMISSSSQTGLERPRELIHRLKSRDFYRQVGDHVKLRLQPQCFGCGCDTEIHWRFCPSCGKPTGCKPGSGKGYARKKCEIKRKGRAEQVPPKTSASGQSCISSPLPMAGAVAEDEYEEDWAAPDYDLKAEQAKQMILDFCEPPLSEEEKAKVFVHIVDIAHGKKTTVPDPWDPRRMWKTYDPLARVGFFNPKEAVDGAEPEIRHCPREQIPRIFLPAAQHLRTLYCYLKTSQAEAERDATYREHAEELQERVEAALDAWKKDRKVGAQLGTSNATPSRCSSQHGSQQASVNSTPRGEGRMKPKALARTDLASVPE